MQLGRVVGTVVSTVKEPRMQELKLQVLRLLDEKGGATGSYTVAVDAVGAGQGDVVLFAAGSSARQTGVTEGKPTDATIMAIVDSWDVGGTVVYQAGSASDPASTPRPSRPSGPKPPSGPTGPTPRVTRP